VFLEVGDTVKDKSDSVRFWCSASLGFSRKLGLLLPPSVPFLVASMRPTRAVRNGITAAVAAAAAASKLSAPLSLHSVSEHREGDRERETDRERKRESVSVVRARNMT